MPWSRFTWVDDDGSLTVGTPFTAARMNNIEDGVEEARRVSESLYDTFSKPTSGISTLTWTHTPLAPFIRGVIVGVAQNYRAKLAFGVTKVTYGGIEMKRLMLHEEASVASHAFYWLPSSELPQGPQTVVVTVANTEAKRQAFCASVVADGPVRPLYRTTQAPAATQMGAEISNTLETGAYFGMASVTQQPTVKVGGEGESVLSENLGSEGTPMWMAVQAAKNPNAGKGTGSTERPQLNWTMASAAYATVGVLIGRVKDWGLRSTLPTLRAGIGDTCRFEVSGVVWDLVYDGEGEFPWKKIGGPPLRDSTYPGASSASSYGTTSIPKITYPLSGDYYVSFGCSESARSNIAGDSGFFRAAYFSNGVIAAQTIGRGSTFLSTPLNGKVLATKLTKGQQADTRFKNDGGNSTSWEGLYIEIDPVRVGA